MAYVIERTYLGKIKPRQMFKDYMSHDAWRLNVSCWVHRVFDIKICDNELEAIRYAEKYKRAGDTYNIVNKDDNRLAKAFLTDEGWMV